MPSIDDNRKTWDEHYEWDDGGDVWSTAWGGPDMQWYGALMARAHLFLPAPTILEIAPGFGRWTQFLKDACERLIAVDVAEKCVRACKARFAESSHVEVHLNDGKSLGMVEDGEIDFAFSFDSLVHVEADAMEAYVGELGRVLAPDGVAFIHHSNIGAYPELENPHHRGTSMTAEKFVQYSSENDLNCVGQELLNWGSAGGLIDCISVATKPGSRWDRDLVVVKNDGFAEETRRLQRLATAFGARSFSDPATEWGGNV